jgi:hypothetical protein
MLKLVRVRTLSLAWFFLTLFTVASLTFTSFVPVANSQGRGPAGMQQPQTLSVIMPGNSPAGDDRLQRAQAARIFVERQTQLRVDTAKLLALSMELKQQVDKTDIDVLSLEVVKKAQEIQKLAKSVQDKMKNGY